MALKTTEIGKIFNEIEKRGLTASDVMKLLKDPSAKGKAASTKYADFVAFFKKQYPETRKDYFRGTVYTKNISFDGKWSPIDNHIKTIESDCHENGLNANYTARHLSAWTDKLKPELLIDVPEWDGKDHILDALTRISVKNIEHRYFVELMKEWFASVVRRMNNPSHQNRCVIFRGQQGLGKDFCINAMLSGFGRYANEIDVSREKTEIYRIIKNLAVAIIPEFDETQRSAISTLKSIITAKSVEMRALYKNESTSSEIRCSFISASNFENILRDSSGNRRYMIFDLEEIEHSFEEVNGEQIMAQCFSLAKEKYVAGLDARHLMDCIIKAETPISGEELFKEEVNELLIRKTTGIMVGKIRWPEIAKEVKEIGRSYGFKGRSCQNLMKSAGFTHCDNASSYYLPAASENPKSN